MKVLSVESFGAFLSKKGDRIVVRKNGQRVAEVSAGNVDLIRVSSRGVSASMDVVKLALKYGIPIVVTSKGGVPLGVFMPFKARGLIRVKRAQYTAVYKPLGVEVAKELVRAKLEEQARLLHFLARTWRRAGDLKPLILVASASLSEASSTVSNVAGDSCEKVRGVLMSLEARGAQIYWSALARLVPEGLGFQGRVKRGAGDVVNSMLNYGYAILATEVWLAILRAGLDPWAGFLHADSQRRPGLVYDLMEPFRAPVVDKAVLGLVAQKGALLKDFFDGERLTAEGKGLVAKAVVERLNSQVRVTGRKLTISALILLTARRLAGRLVGGLPRFRVPRVGW